MNPLYQMVFASVLARKRVCPKCGRAQVVPQGKKKETINCKFCGAPVPPKKIHN